jgi:hypothetical protein
MRAELIQKRREKSACVMLCFFSNVQNASKSSKESSTRGDLFRAAQAGQYLCPVAVRMNDSPQRLQVAAPPMWRSSPRPRWLGAQDGQNF